MANLKTQFPYIARGDQRIQWFKTQTFNIDNGSGTTIDDIVFADLDKDAYVVHVRAVYDEATDTAGAASANFKLGTAAGGATVVAATALEVSKAVGSTTEATVVAGLVTAGSSLFCRHTGIAATEGGKYYVQVGVLVEP